MSEERKIEILKNIKEYMQSCINEGHHKFVYNDLGYDEKCIDIINAIEDLLDLYNKEKEKNEKGIKALEILRQYFSEDLQPDFIYILEILRGEI